MKYDRKHSKKDLFVLLKPSRRLAPDLAERIAGLEGSGGHFPLKWKNCQEGDGPETIRRRDTDPSRLSEDLPRTSRVRVYRDRASRSKCRVRVGPTAAVLAHSCTAAQEKCAAAPTP